MADVIINSISDLLAFASGQYGYGSSSAYLSVELGADLDFAEYDEHYNFAGCKGGNWFCNFDGKEHTIDNIRYEGTDPWAFFCSNYFRGSIKNLNLTNVYVVTTREIGGLVYHTQNVGGNVLIQNCHISGQLECLASNNVYVSGLVHNIYGYAYIYDSSFSGYIEGATENVFGIVCHSFEYASGIRNYAFNCMVNSDVILPNAYFFPIAGLGCAAHNCEYKGVAKAKYLNPVVASNSIANHCILIYEAGSNSSTGEIRSESPITLNKVFVDADQLAAAGITIPSGLALTGATTAQLKDSSWLRSEGFAL